MSRFIVNAYDWLSRHWLLRTTTLALLTVVLFVSLLGQRYHEDISDFLPLDNKYRKAMQVWQEVTGADRIVAVFQCRDTAAVDPDLLAAAADTWLSQLDSLAADDVRPSVVTGGDLEQYAGVTAFAYSHIPYFLTDEDYARMDSLLADSSYVSSQLDRIRQLLMFPASGLLADNFRRDPLNLFTPVVARLQPSGMAAGTELYDGHLFSDDLRRALVVLATPYGASETQRNAALLDLLGQTADATEAACPGVQVTLVGAPVVAVGNARQIRSDSVLSVSLSVTLIVLLLFVAFRNLRNLLLMVLSIGWGWLFAMGLLSCVHDGVSVIVVGISSVILGIAVNYPLHLIAHQQHTPDVRTALKEIATPLVVGNVTTVGAFLALVPLKSVALRDLGLFSSLLLAGTILFVLLFLPHLVSPCRHPVAGNVFSRLGNVTMKDRPWMVWCIAGLTLFLGYFSMQTTFDADMSHINYMTDAQKADFAALQQLSGQQSAAASVYVVATDSTLDGALRISEQQAAAVGQLQDERLVSSTSPCHQFLFSSAEQQRRLRKWESFVTRQSGMLDDAISRQATAAGFAEGSFADFSQLLHCDYRPLPADSFSVLYQSVLASHVVADSANRRYHVVDVLTTTPEWLAQVEQQLDKVTDNGYAFDVAGMNAAVANSISGDFSYIGWVCSLVVFLFLWLSLGSIELAVLSFLPMALSWVWILGLMSLFHIQFNVVSVILATFIFGQGDDYTIFMTEGCQYEYAHRRPMLASYKSSIILSALIMFIGIGTLLTARHPALRSLAQVTVVGMSSVVLMACILPPLLFRWLVCDSSGHERRRPLTLHSLLFRSAADASQLVADRYRYRGAEISRAVRRQLRYWRQHPDELPRPAGGHIVTADDGWGETPLLLALLYPDCEVTATLPDDERRRVAVNAAAGVAGNLHYVK